MSTIKISQLPVATTPLSGAEQIPLVQSGVTKRTTATALGVNRVVSVKSFGAVGDGIADDTAAIQAAIAYAATLTAPILVVDQGVYFTTSV
jgi:polygalacturonase